jgi:hypothetical protein
MDQNLYKKHQLMEFERIEILIPIVIVAIGLVLLGMAYIFEWNKMAFSAALGMIIICFIYKIVNFFLNLWEYK